MKKIIAPILFLLFAFTTKAQNIGIGTNTPHQSAALDIADTTKGILIPRMTMAQRNAIQNPAEGLMVYQTDSISSFYFMNNGEWKMVDYSPTNLSNVGTEMKLFSTIPLIEGTHYVPTNESWKIVSIQTLPGFGSSRDSLNFQNCINQGSLYGYNNCYYSTPPSKIVLSINNQINFLGTYSGSQGFSIGQASCSSCPAKKEFTSTYTTNISINLPYWLNTGEQIIVGENLRVQLERYKFN
jgi:hypothetical protein